MIGISRTGRLLQRLVRVCCARPLLTVLLSLALAALGIAYTTESAASSTARSTVTRGRAQDSRTMPRRIRPVCVVSDKRNYLFFARDEALEPRAGDVVGPLLGR